MAVHAGAWMCWFLDFCGWVILLSGVSAMQQSCGASAADFLLGGGSAGFNAAVPCDVFFEYTWWMTFYNLFLLILTAIVLSTNSLPTFRPGLVTLSAVGAMMSMIIANTYLYYNSLPTTSGTFTARARVTVAGGIIKAIALLLMIGFTGARDESTTVYEPPMKKEAMRGGYRVNAERVSGGGGSGKKVQLTPVSTNVLEPQTLAVTPPRPIHGASSLEASPATTGSISPV